MSLYYELTNIYKYEEKSSLNIFLVFLKIGSFERFWLFFLISKKRSCFKELKNSWFHRKKGYFFPNNFLKRSHILHARTHMCTDFSYESSRQGLMSIINILETFLTFQECTFTAWNKNWAVHADTRILQVKWGRGVIIYQWESM